MRFLIGLPASVLALLLAGCTLLPETQPVDVFRLPASGLAASPQSALAASLRIARPQSSQALDSNRIAVVPRGDLLSSYQGARWSSPAPALLRDHLLDALQRDGRFKALVSDDSHLQADLLLDGDLRAFQVEYAEGGPQARILIDLHLADANSQRIRASRRFSISQPLAAEQVSAAVSAFGMAADHLAAQVAVWLGEELAASEGAASR